MCHGVWCVYKDVKKVHARGHSRIKPATSMKWILKMHTHR